jgi:all-trans-8'-apo-beta-carotenal 15,15'-oxygenase
MNQAVPSARPATTSPTPPPVRPRPSSPPWMGGFQDLAREHAFSPLVVEGKLPIDLVGTLYRNGPGRFGIGGERYGHWFDGDGVMSAVRLEGGRALGAARVTKTAGLVREQAAGARLFGGYDTPVKRPVRELFLGDRKNTANTAVLLWQGRVFATCEAGKPFEIDAADLASIGETDLAVIEGAFSAHAHRVPSRRCTYNFGVSHRFGTTLRVYAMPDEGPARCIARLPLDGVRLVHDFVVTERYLVFAIAPQYLSLWRTLRGQGPVGSAAWKENKGTEILVIPIDAPADVVRFQTDAFLMEHLVNAFDDGDDVVFDYTHYKSAEGLERYVRGFIRGAVDGPLGSTIRRARVNVKGRRLTSETILDHPVELPRVAPRVECARHRFAYCVRAAEDAPFVAVLKHDTESGRIETYSPGDARYPGEPVFVPRDTASAEDDGWLLTLVYDAGKDRSCLEVLDARGIGDGPVASCWFPHPIPFGFHGAWASRQTR